MMTALADVIKVEYHTLGGFRSTAYLDGYQGEYRTGTNKHTDEPVTVYWTGAAWIEIEEE
jgi:hypothetical protein